MYIGSYISNHLPVKKQPTGNSIQRFHTKIGTKDSGLTCTFCGKSYVHRSSLCKHVRVHHSEEVESGSIECSTCNRRYIGISITQLR